MINNAVCDADGKIVGYRCRICDGVFQSMWDETCNGCRERQRLALLATSKGQS